MDKNTKDLLDALDFIKDRMATKEDVREIMREELKEYATKNDVRQIVGEVVDEKLRPIHAALAEINRRLDALEEHYANLKGVTKEIDEIRDEVRVIQKHLGIDKKIAA